MPERLIGIEGIASVQFHDGTIAGKLGRIADAGFELIRPDDSVVIVSFAAIDSVENRIVKLTCEPGALAQLLVS